MSELSLRGGLLAGLSRAIRASAAESEISQSLRALQRSGISRDDLRVHVERLRAANDACDYDADVEESALLALDLIEEGGGGLSWDATTIAADAVYRLRNELPIVASITDALVPSDLLPVSSVRPMSSQIAGQLVATFKSDILDAGEYKPSPAYFVRAPKREFTTRPAAVLAVPDRIVFEALAAKISSKLADLLPDVTLWPRPQTNSRDAFRSFKARSAGWGGSYNAEADIENFYEYVDHAILSRIARDTLGMSLDYCLALESFLNSLMETSRGLPQGPTASETFATLYLLPLDLTAIRAGWHFVRYQDDYAIRAESYEDAREHLRQLEGALRDLGLRLSSQKTAIVKISTVRARESVDVSPYGAATAAGRLEDDEELVPTASSVFVQCLSELSSSPDWALYLRLRDALVACTRQSDTDVPLEAIALALNWFPQLTPDAVFFLAAKRRGGEPEAVDELIRSRFSAAPAADWENAWLFRVVDLSEKPLTNTLQTLFDRVVKDPNGAPMTRFNAFVSLHMAGKGGVDVTAALRDSLPRALWAEMSLELWPGLKALAQRGE